MIYVWDLVPVTSVLSPASEIVPDRRECRSRVFDSCLTNICSRLGVARVLLRNRRCLLIRDSV